MSEIRAYRVRVECKYKMRESREWFIDTTEALDYSMKAYTAEDAYLQAMLPIGHWIEKMRNSPGVIDFVGCVESIRPDEGISNASC